MKKCSKCKTDKGLSEFYRRKKHRVGEYYEKCKDCYKERGRNYYRLNRDRQLYLAKVRRRKYIEERKNWLEKIKNRPCTDCGRIYPPWVMDFDHKGEKIKIGSISYLTFRNNLNFNKIKEEIKKCDLVCSNCHRERTYRRLQNKTDAEVANVVKAPL